MNTNVFNMKRFGRYFATELETKVKENWVILLILACMGFITWLLCGIFTTLVDGGVWETYSGARVSIFSTMAVIMCVVMPAKFYGNVNVRGTKPAAYLLLPASRLEKYLSMVLITAVVLPLAVIGVALALDWFMCLVDPTAGEPVPAVIRGVSPMFFSGMATGKLIGFWTLIAAVVQFLLVFLLGAVFFRSAKPGKTILALFVYSCSILLLLVLVAVIFFNGNINNDSCPRLFEFIANHLVLIDVINDTIVDALLLTGIWFKLKSIKC